MLGLDYIKRSVVGMRTSKLLALSFGFKCVAVLVFALMLYVHYIVEGQYRYDLVAADSYPWFDRTERMDNLMLYLDTLAAKNPQLLQEQLAAYNSDGINGLMFAGIVGNIELAKMLIEAGINIDALSIEKVHGKNSALHHAVYNSKEPKCYDVAFYLVEMNVQMELRNADYNTALLLSTMMDSIDNNIAPGGYRGDRMRIVELMVKNGANINAQDARGFTLLHKVAELNSQAGVREILERFGDLIDLSLECKEINLYNEGGKKHFTARDYAYNVGWRDVAQVFDDYVAHHKPLEARSVIERDRNGFTSLMMAVMKKDNKLVLNLLKKGADINAQSADNYKNSPLHYAVLFKNMEGVDLLVREGASSIIANGYGNMPVHYVGRLDGSANRIKALDMLLKNNQLIERALNAKNSWGYTILHLAVLMRDESLVKHMVEKYGYALDLGVFDERGKTAYRLAKEINAVTIAAMLDDLAKAKGFAIKRF